MKKCPYCAEEIQDEAIVCRYCGRDLTKLVTPLPPPVEQIKEQPKTPTNVQSIAKPGKLSGTVVKVRKSSE